MTTTAIDPTGTFIAWQSFSSAHGDVRLGEIVRGSHPAVVAMPHLFVPADTPPNEWPSELDHSIKMTELAAEQAAEERRERFVREAGLNRVHVETALVRAVRDFTCLLNGRPATVTKGSVVVADSELAHEFPENFKPA